MEADELTGSQSSAGAVVAVYYVAAGFGARIAGRLMDRFGRRPGLAAGYLLFAIGGAGSFLASWARTAEGLLVATFVLGLGASAALLGRAAVADMYLPERRGRAVGRLVLAGTVGAVAGPWLSSAVESAAGPAVPWLLIPAFTLSALPAVLALRPDPRALAVGGAVAVERGGAGAVLRTRPGRAAVAAIGVSQAVMATFMAIVPVALNRAHAGHGTISLVVGLHIGAMFAFSPLIGTMLDRWGRRRSLLAGLAATAAGVALCAFTAGTSLPSGGLLLVGFGWSVAYLGSTAAISDLAPAAQRASALGATDLVAGVSAAIGVLAGAWLTQASGLAALGGASLALAAAPLLLVAALREAAPGRWATA